ncbi:MAG: hypothetical protein VX515_02885 [Candidatus Thermoplasmatota archaeon]|nr:hypothetical protein [Candidatus Thermoplasmatota archaeon]
MEDDSEFGIPSKEAVTSPLSDSLPTDGDAVICRIREKERTVIDSEGVIESREVDGSVEILNPSVVDRIWGVSLHLDGTGSTSMDEEAIKLREIQPDSSHLTSYTADPEPLLSIREIIDSEPVRDEVPSNSLPYTNEPHPVKVKIEIENVGSDPLIDIEIVRSIPPEWEFSPDLGYSVSEDALIWKIPRLDISEVKSLDLEPIISISSTQSIGSGEITATYKSPGLLSTLVPISLRASTRHVSYVTATEGERPGEWGCVCSFENASSFSLTMEAASMEVVGREEPLLSISGMREVVRPLAKWESQSVPYASNERPRFTQKIQSSVAPAIDIGSAGSLILRSKSLPIVDARVEKGYAKSRIRSYTEDVVQTKIKVENVGSATINLLRMVDDLPPIFEKVKLSDISVEIGSRVVDTENMRLDIVDGRSLTAEEISGDGHTIQLLIGTTSPVALQPGEVLTIKYPAITSDPSATGMPIGSPCRGDLSSERHGPVITRECVKIPAISVITQRREVRTGKSIFPGPELGQHEIRLLFTNTSDTPLEDVTILDSIGLKFEMLSSEVSVTTGRTIEVNHSSEKNDRSEIHRWGVGRVECGESIEVVALIESEDLAADPEAEGSLGAEFGEEAEVEPNLPKWFGEDGEWIHGIEEHLEAPVPVCAVCGGDILPGGLVCANCAATSPYESIASEEEE